MSITNTSRAGIPSQKSIYAGKRKVTIANNNNYYYYGPLNPERFVAPHGASCRDKEEEALDRGEEEVTARGCRCHGALR